MKAIVLKIQSVRFYYNYNYTRRDSTNYGATSNNNSTSFLPVPFQKISTVDRRLKRTKQSIKLYDDNVGPLENIYETSIQATSVLYDRAKAKHEQGIEVLKKQYDYHPAFSKGRPGEFRGVPFTPKQIVEKVIQ